MPLQTKSIHTGIGPRSWHLLLLLAIPSRINAGVDEQFGQSCNVAESCKSPALAVDNLLLQTKAGRSQRAGVEIRSAREIGENTSVGLASAEHGFAKITDGACAGIDWAPISDEENCAEAARQIGLEDTAVKVTNQEDRPEGCYYHRSQALWFGRNPVNIGRGSETSSEGQDRHQICMLKVKKISIGSCGDFGMSPILSADTCTAAARELNLKYDGVRLTNTQNRPEGCYHMDDQWLWLGTHATNAGKGAETSNAAHTRHPLCIASNAATTETPAGSTTPPEPQSTTLPMPAPPSASLTVCYTSGKKDGSCPPGSTRAQLDDCKNAANQTLGNGENLRTFGNKLEFFFAQGCEEFYTPGAGCFYDDWNTLFSTTLNCTIAEGRGERWALCTYECGSTTTTTPPPTALVKKIETGSCADYGLSPILSTDSCSAAASKLGLTAVGGLRTTNNEHRPEGCYQMDDQWLWLGTNPANAGKGAETSTTSHSRHPLCMAVVAHVSTPTPTQQRTLAPSPEPTLAPTTATTPERSCEQRPLAMYEVSPLGPLDDDVPDAACAPQSDCQIWLQPCNTSDAWEGQHFTSRRCLDRPDGAEHGFMAEAWFSAAEVQHGCSSHAEVLMWYFTDSDCQHGKIRAGTPLSANSEHCNAHCCDTITGLCDRPCKATVCCY